MLAKFDSYEAMSEYYYMLFKRLADNRMFVSKKFFNIQQKRILKSYRQSAKMLFVDSKYIVKSSCNYTKCDVIQADNINVTYWLEHGLYNKVSILLRPKLLSAYVRLLCQRRADRRKLRLLVQVKMRELTAEPHYKLLTYTSAETSQG